MSVCLPVYFMQYIIYNIQYTYYNEIFWQGHRLLCTVITDIRAGGGDGQKLIYNILVSLTNKLLFLFN